MKGMFESTLETVFGITLGAETSNPKVGQAATNILKSKSGGKILS